MTKDILHIISSPRENYSFSNGLSNAIIRKITGTGKGSKITERNLIVNQPPMLNASQIRAFYKHPDQRSEGEKQSLLYSDVAIREIQNANIIVIGIAMYNLAIPASLKAWIDQIVRIGVSFRTTEDGRKIGLFRNKKVYLAIASGRIHANAGYRTEFIESYLNIVFKSIGITDVTTFRVEGTAKRNVQEVNFNEIIANLSNERTCINV